ncbi:hypothetical protein [Colwellia psychrerythraea]|uniref:Uncharacterized protein n=1 Tax=Colwellia psychrerythraea TaxID=28229 RepID=A0A099KYR4_COLPS|nr:hypothetical protein [Colwellia psychrerythraea]KGJ94788.1 hypothetical protein GAB14E_2022 [Colwellia psychrerythraea]
MNKITIKIILSLTFIILLMKGLTMANTNNDKLFYGVDIDLNGVGVDVRVNDIPVYFDDEKGQLTVEVPAPDSIVDGENILSIKTFLPYDGDSIVENYSEGAYVTATLFQQDLSLNNGIKLKLATATVKLTEDHVSFNIENITTKQQKSEEIELNKDKSHLIKVATTINSPFPQWVWQDGKSIENNSQNFESLLKKYQTIHEALENKDLEKLKALYSKRAAETSIAYNLPDEEAGHLKLSVGVDMHDKELELYDFQTEGMRLEILANGKLARVIDSDKDQPILYFNSSSQLIHLYKFMFYLNKQNEWVMVR